MNWNHQPAPQHAAEVPRGGSFWDAISPEYLYITFNDHGFATAHTHMPTKAVVKGTGAADKNGQPEVISSRWNSAGKQHPIGICELPSGSNLSGQVLTRPISATEPSPVAAPARTEPAANGMVEKAPIHPTLGALPVAETPVPEPKALTGLRESIAASLPVLDLDGPTEVESSTPSTVGDLATLTEVVSQLADAVELLATLDSLAGESGARGIVKKAIHDKLGSVRKALGG